MQLPSKTHTSSSSHSAETEMFSGKTPRVNLDLGRPARRATLEDHALKFIERNNRGIWVGILALCAITVLVTERG